MKAKRVTGAAMGAGLMASMMVLTACDPSGGTAPGAVSEGEAEALEEAAEMLDERQLPAGTLPPIDANAVPEEPSEAAPADAETSSD